MKFEKVRGIHKLRPLDRGEGRVFDFVTKFDIGGGGFGKMWRPLYLHFLSLKSWKFCLKWGDIIISITYLEASVIRLILHKLKPDNFTLTTIEIKAES